MAVIIPESKSPFLMAPFIYKIDPADYATLTEAAIENINLFREIGKLIEKFHQAGNDKETFQKYHSRLQEYQKLLKRWQDAPWKEKNFRMQALQFLQELEHYHYFFKETGAGLKFSPLSVHSSGNEIRIRMRDLLQEYLPLIQPKALYLFMKTILDENGIIVNGAGIRFNSQKLAKFFSAPYAPSGTMHSKIVATTTQGTDKIKAGVQKMVLYLVTIGPGIDDTIQSMMRDGNIFDAYLLNGIGGGAAEMVAYDLNLYANDHFTEDNISAQFQRFSPGYGDWSVRDQGKVFVLLEPEHKIGVRLTEGDIMIPEKSTSGIMGLKMFRNRR